MHPFDELRSLYSGGKADRIRLQSNPDVQALADWLATTDSPVEAWAFYLRSIKTRASTGGPLFLSERVPDERWIRARILDWESDSKMASLSILQGLAREIETHSQTGWESLSVAAMAIAEEEGWLSPLGEALMACPACGHHILAEWAFIDDLTECTRCSSDIYKVMPVSVSPHVKEAILKGVLLEVAVARSIKEAGGRLFSIQLDAGQVHEVGLEFKDPLHTIEVDTIGLLGDSLVFAECSDVGLGRVLSINDLQKGASKVSRLLANTEDVITSTPGGQPSVLFVTTGELHQSLSISQLNREGLHHLPCHVVDAKNLHGLVNRLSQGLKEEK